MNYFFQINPIIAAIVVLAVSFLVAQPFTLMLSFSPFSKDCYKLERLDLPEKDGTIILFKYSVSYHGISLNKTHLLVSTNGMAAEVFIRNLIPIDFSIFAIDAIAS